LCLLATAGCGFNYGPKESQGTIDVYYVDGATKAEAERVAAYLQKAWGEAPARRTVQLKKDGDTYQFRMVIKKEFQNDEPTLKKLAFDGARISRETLDSAPVDVHACDTYLTTLKVVPMRPDVRYSLVQNTIEVFYPSPTDKDDADRLAKYLAKITNNKSPISFKLARRDKVVEIHMVTNQEALKNPELVAALQHDRKAINDNVFPGQIVELHLCDDVFNVVQVLKE